MYARRVTRALFAGVLAVPLLLGTAADLASQSQRQSRARVTRAVPASRVAQVRRASAQRREAAQRRASPSQRRVSASRRAPAASSKATRHSRPKGQTVRALGPGRKLSPTIKRARVSKRQGGTRFGDPRPERPAVKGRPSRIEGTPRIERPYRPERTARLERPSRLEQTARIERPYRPERTARLERPHRDRLQIRHWYPRGWYGYGRTPFFRFPHRHRYGRSRLFRYGYGAGCYFDPYGYNPYRYGAARYFGRFGYGPYGYGAGLNFGFRFGFHDFLFGANYGWPGVFGCPVGAFFRWW
jgi:hypothetical protein